jgi:hypothetical protein
MQLCVYRKNARRLNQMVPQSFLMQIKGSETKETLECGISNHRTTPENTHMCHGEKSSVRISKRVKQCLQLQLINNQ